MNKSYTRVERNISLLRGKYYQVHVRGRYLGTYPTLEDARSARDVFWAGEDKYKSHIARIDGLQDRFNQAVTDSGLSIADISKQTHICTGNLCRYFNEGLVPKVDNLAKLAVCLNVSTDWLLGLENRREILHDIV